jgi:hypothetical protein
MEIIALCDRRRTQGRSLADEARGSLVIWNLTESQQMYERCPHDERNPWRV